MHLSIDLELKINQKTGNGIGINYSLKKFKKNKKNGRKKIYLELGTIFLNSNRYIPRSIIFLSIYNFRFFVTPPIFV